MWWHMFNPAQHTDSKTNNMNVVFKMSICLQKTPKLGAVIFILLLALQPRKHFRFMESDPRCDPGSVGER